jgi:hypothetical protein
VVVGVPCFNTFSAGVRGDGKALSSTLICDRVSFSWELVGSGASLLGTGVIFERLGLAVKLILVLSRRQLDEGPLVFGVLAEEAGVEEALLKKPKMLRCLPPEADALPVFLEPFGVFAGVRTGIEEAFSGAIVIPSSPGYGDISQSLKMPTSKGRETGVIIAVGNDVRFDGWYQKSYGKGIGYVTETNDFGKHKSRK